MRIIPVLFPSDLGRSDRGHYVEGGVRGAPDLLLDVLEGEGVRFGRPVTIPVPPPTEDASEDTPLKFEAEHAQAAEALAAAVADINAEADFPLILGGDHTALFGHVLGHSARHPQGIGLGVLADAMTDLYYPGTPVYEDRQKLKQDETATPTGDANRMVVAGALRQFPKEGTLGQLLEKSSVQASQTSIVGVRTPDTKQVRTLERRTGIEVWRMERLELDGEQAYRSLLNQHLARGPIVLSVDVGGLDPDLMTAVTDPVPDGLDWSFLKRTFEQCIPHVDRILGIDICELDPTKDDAHKLAQIRFAETFAPFLKKIAGR